MKKNKVLYYAIKQAEKNGFKYRWEHVIPDEGERYEVVQFIHELHPEIIIFDHDFAKAFFGQHTSEMGCVIEDWKIELERMVICDDYLEYLEGFLDE